MPRSVLVILAAVSLALMAIGVHLIHTPLEATAPVPGFDGADGLGVPPPGARADAAIENAVYEARRDGLPIAIGAVLLTATGLSAVAPQARRHLRTGVLFLLAYLALLPLGGLLVAGGHATPYGWLRGLQVFCAAVTGVSLVAVALFDVAVPLTRVPSRPILRDLITGLAYVVMTFVVLRSAGVPLKELLPAGALATGLVGLAIQSTLADVAGGLILEWEDSIEVGDWVRIGDVSGIVKEIRWRFTRVETRNWESVLIPNSVLSKQNVVVLGRTDGRPLQVRRWVYFTVGYEHRPANVIACVDAALQASPIERVAAEPRPHCILFDHRENGCYYAVRYWLKDIAVDDPTDSLVRLRIQTALCRAGMDLAIPRRKLNMTVDDDAARTREASSTTEGRVAILRRFSLFDMLTRDELLRLVPSVSPVPFSRGEVMTRQDAEAHWLYLLVKGRATVQLRTPTGETKTVAKLEDGDHFGEMALFTGERRSATVIAETDCDCWRLERQGFKDVVQARPEIASAMSELIAKRRLGLEQTLAQAGPPTSLAAEQRRVFAEISRFFGLSE